GEYHMHDLAKYVDAPPLKHRGFYHVTEPLLGEVWWKIPSFPQQVELVARYPEIIF
ncbi:unnamed protein product, partial [marine sediment metagenome]